MSDLSSWCLRHYDTLHDFSGPIATVIAATAAVIVTWTLGKRQVGIARLQADIAKRQAETAQYRLRYDLFEKRYVIYKTTREILDVMISDALAADGALDVQDIAAKFRILDEAHFIFPSQICDFLDRVHHDVEHAVRLHKRHIVNKGGTEAQRDQAGDELVDALARLAVIRRTLPASFEVAMSLAQLSDEPPSSNTDIRNAADMAERTQRGDC